MTSFFVGATLGTTGQVAFDNMEEIEKICEEYDTLWFHADGAYGGNLFIVPEQVAFDRF